MEECPGTRAISDDVCVYGKTEEHDENLRTLMEVSKRRGLVFNKDKCHMKKELAREGDLCSTKINAT